MFYNRYGSAKVSYVDCITLYTVVRNFKL